MKSIRRTTIILLGIFMAVSSAFAQKEKVSAAEKLAKGKTPDFTEARQLIQAALKDPSTAQETKTWYVAGFIEDRHFTKENLKQLDGVKPDFAPMNQALLDMFDFYQEAYKRDNQADERGRVRPRFTKDILKSYEENINYFINAGGYYMEQRDFHNAVRAFDCFRAIKRLPDFAGKPIAQVDTTSMMVDFFRVVALYQDGKKKEAIQAGEEIKEVDYRRNELLQILAQTYSEENMMDEYIRTMEYGGSLYPDEPFYAVNLINTYVQMGKTEEALKALDVAIAKSPENAQLYLVKGQLYTTSNHELAMESFQKALEIDPDNIDSNYEMGRLLYNTAVEVKSADMSAANEKKGDELLKQALPYLEKVFEKDPAKAAYMLSSIYYSLKMYDKYEATKLYVEE